MANTLIAGGDSFVWGSELADSPHGGPDGYSRSTFTALLAKQSGLDYHCAAYPGLSNSEITKKVKIACELYAGPVIVSWSWPSRDNKIDSDAEIVDLQTYLKTQNRAYLFTCADNCIVTNNQDIEWHNWFLFPIISNSGWHTNEEPRGFYQWALEHKYKIAEKDKHPLELAHSDAANLMKEKFNDMVKKFMEQNPS